MTPAVPKSTEASGSGTSKGVAAPSSTSTSTALPPTIPAAAPATTSTPLRKRSRRNLCPAERSKLRNSAEALERQRQGTSIQDHRPCYPAEARRGDLPAFNENTYRDAVTPKRVLTEPVASAHIIEIGADEVMAINQLSCSGATLEPGATIVPDPYETYLKHIPHGEYPAEFTVTRNSNVICSIIALVDNKEQIECIVDPGSQIVAMSEEVCLGLNLLFDPTIQLNMQLANGEVDRSLGLIRNVPFRIGEIVLYLQAHVIRNTAYDILLGRPFNVLTQSVVKNFADENQTITILCLNTGETVTIPTFEELIPHDQGEAVLVIDYDGVKPSISFVSTIDSSTPNTVLSLYLSACTSVSSYLQSLYASDNTAANAALSNASTWASTLLFSAPFASTPPTPTPTKSISQFSNSILLFPSTTSTSTPSTHKILAATKKKYKPVALKTRPILGAVPEQFRILRDIKGDPLSIMPKLSTDPPPFKPTGRYTLERFETTEKLHDGDFLLPDEHRVLHHFMCLHNEAFTWTDDERGCFKPEYFPPVDFPVVPHTPWVQKNIPIPPGIYNEVCAVIKRKIAAGVYEPSNSSYRSRWFCVVKKDSKSLRLVHSLEPLNAVTIQHSGVPPTPEYLAEQFGGRPCSGMLDLYVGYDERLIAKSSRLLTTFQTPYGAMRLVTLPMGWTNSVPIFHDDVTYILQPEIPHDTVPYVDDVPVKGPESDYDNERFPSNHGIRRFVWEHFENMNRVVTRMRYAGGTFSGVKSVLIAREIMVVGHRCTPQGHLPDGSRVAAICNWGPCATLSDVRAFLGTIGVVRIFIRNFAHRADALVCLTRKDIEFEFGPEQIAAQEDLKDVLLSSPALRAINYESPSPVILAVDTLFITVGYHLCQCDEANTRVRYYSRFGSITLNDRERRFSQPKLEIYGLFRALRSLRLYLIGVRNLIVEVDARYIKGMLKNPDIAPSASINRWIVSILTFHFTLVHVPGTMHGPDGLSRRTAQPGDIIEDEVDEEFNDWIDQMHSFIHQIQPLPTVPSLAIFTNDRAEDGSDFNKEEDSYELVPRSEQAQLADAKLDDVLEFHRTLAKPDGISESVYEGFIKYCMQFFLDNDTLWRKDSHGAHKLVVKPGDRLRMLRKETAKALADWIFEDILCRWGALSEIVTDNGTVFIKAADYLSKKYHINHIRISGYNSRANGLVERPHFSTRQALFKTADGDEKKWSQAAYFVFWSERITTCRRMGCSPYFAVTGTHPLIPLDIVEATYLQPPPTLILSTTDLIARRAIALQKRVDTTYETLTPNLGAT
ncbi:hypothetical protein IEO21_10373 [Rhodonia placenta]|uniref:Integrase catalytic domain-containing protein n=1 Tax=Rhodonia placenta TaxID=104341 RepID=A0A8H7TX10_9APHY|nr:hypothetical protein IEO21_10373 [Postia placenta]